MTVAWMVTAAAWNFPLAQYLTNSSAIIQPLRHGLIFVGFAALLLGAVAGVHRLGVRNDIATYGVVVATTLFWSGRIFTNLLGGTGGLAAGVAMLLIVLLVVWRLRDFPPVHMLFFAWAVYLTIGPWVINFDWDLNSTLPPVENAEASRIPYTDTGYLPDVFVVVVDGYSGIQTLEEFEAWDGEVVHDLVDRGFNVPPAWSAYSSTSVSLSGMFDASYAVQPVGEFATEARPADRFVTEGDAAGWHFFGEAGYDMTVIETPWYGYRCPPMVDTCVKAPTLDDLLFYTLKQSFLGVWLDQNLGSAWIHGARRTWGWLGENTTRLAENEIPDLVVAHLVLPHEPFLLDEQCDIRVGADFERTAVRGDDLPAYLAQARCLDSMLVDMADLVPSDAIVLYTADHGSALSGQHRRSPGDWTLADIRERLSAFFALRAPAECQPAEPVIVQRAFRSLIRCIGAPELDELETRMFPSALYLEEGRLRMVELTATDIERVIGESE